MTVVSDYTALLPGGASTRWNGASAPGTATFVSYSFLETAELPTTGEEPPLVAGTTDEYHSLDALRRAAIRDALTEFAAVTGIVFVEVEEDEDASIRIMGNWSDSNTSWAYYPYQSPYYSDHSLVVLTEDSDPALRSDSDWDRGNSMFTLTLHELGHAMGLEHPHEGTNTLDTQHDSHEYTVMSYDWDWSGGGPPSYDFVDTLRPYDVQALDYLYGTPAGIDASWVYGWDAIARRFQLAGSGASEVLYGIEASSLVDGLAGDDLLAARGGDDTLRGGQGNDTLHGNIGDDLLAGGAGDDVLSGGPGADSVSYVTSASGITVNMSNGSPQAISASEGTDRLDSIEHLRGSAYGDDIHGSYHANRIAGYAGDDSIHGDYGNDSLFGGSGDDTLMGSYGNDHLDGGPGRDWASYDSFDGAVTVNLNLSGGQFVSSNLGTDTLVGIENILGSSYADTLLGDGGANHIAGGNGSDTIWGGAGNDTLEAGSGSDDTFNGYFAPAGIAVNLTHQGSLRAIGGGLGSDLLSGFENVWGGARGDALTGDGAANDLYGFGGNDTLDGRGGNDLLTGGGANDFIQGRAGNDTLQGEWGNDTLGGGGGTDVLIGGDGDDDLWGGAGTDLLEGGPGADALNGGPGDDLFDFNATTESNNLGRDSILDFEWGDRIDLRTIDSDSTAAGDQAFTWVGLSGWSAAGDLRLIMSGTDSLVFGDVDGDASADFSLMVMDYTVDATSFYL